MRLEHLLSGEDGHQGLEKESRGKLTEPKKSSDAFPLRLLVYTICFYDIKKEIASSVQAHSPIAQLVRAPH